MFQIRPLDAPVEDVPSSARQIVGVDTSRAAFVGATPEGPMNVPVTVRSERRYRYLFERSGLDFADPDACTVSAAVRLFFANGGVVATILRLPPIEGGPRTAVQAVGNVAGQTGIHALAGSDPFGLLLTPDAAALMGAPAARAAAAVVAVCVARRAFALLELPYSVRKAADPADAAATWVRDLPVIRHPSAALHFPWLRVPSSRGGAVAVSPNGAIAGIYARTDIARGVWHSPAGPEAALQGVSGLAGGPPGDSAMAVLRSQSIDPLCIDDGRVFVGAARTLAPADDTTWGFVAVRRTALFIEESVRRDLGWTALEPNRRQLWARVQASVTHFLDQLFHAGAFKGTVERDAWFVRCGTDTMTRADRAAGRLVLEIGFAPLNSAGFVVLRPILQAAAG